MTTAEKNATIARWMGNVIDTSSGMYINQYHNFPTDHSVFPVELEYHSDWNWLHQAIDKIESTPRGKFSPNTFPVVTINWTCCNIKFHHNGEKTIVDIIRPTKIEAVHEAVYQFVVWHNQQVKENPKP